MRLNKYRTVFYNSLQSACYLITRLLKCLTCCFHKYYNTQDRMSVLIKYIVNEFFVGKASTVFSDKVRNKNIADLFK